MLERVPGSYLLIGNGERGERTAADEGAALPPPGACMVHHPGYDFHDDNVAVGAAFWVRLVERFLVDQVGQVDQGR
jgi:hippurate hydrolase